MLDNSHLFSSLEFSPMCSQSTFHTCYSFVSPLQAFFFFFGHAMRLMGCYFPNQGLNLGSQQWEHRVLITGPSANPPVSPLLDCEFLQGRDSVPQINFI